MKQDVYIFIGPPGAGKGTLSALCVQRLGWRQISTGNLCRKHIADQTEIGQKIDFAIKSGKLVSDSLITQMVIEAIADLDSKIPVILDGYPRTAVQAEQLREIARNKGSLNIQVVRLVVSENTVVTRLGSRYVCQNKECQAVYSIVNGSELAPQNGMKCDYCDASVGKRPDDEPSAIKERLRVYYGHEAALLNVYCVAKVAIIELSAEKTADSVFNEFIQKFGLGA